MRRLTPISWSTRRHRGARRHGEPHPDVARGGGLVGVHDRVHAGGVAEDRRHHVRDHGVHAGRQRGDQLLVDLLGIGHVDLGWQHHDDRHDLCRLITHISHSCRGGLSPPPARLPRSRHRRRNGAAIRVSPALLIPCTALTSRTAHQMAGYSRADQATAIKAAKAMLPRATSRLTATLAPSVTRCMCASRYGVTALPRTPADSAARERAGERPVVHGRVKLLVGRQRVRHEQRGRVAERVPGRHDRRDLLRRVEAPVKVLAGVGEVEGGEAVRAVPGDRDPEGFQALQGRRDVQDRLHARADHGDRACGTAR